MDFARESHPREKYRRRTEGRTGRKDVGLFVLWQMDSKLPLDTFEAVLALAMDGCKAIAAHMRQVGGLL